MVVADPATELLRLVTDPGDPPPAEPEPAALAQAQLLRRRFGLALPPPFANPPEGADPQRLVRVATPADGPAIGAVKWRAFGTNYRGGVLDDTFLDQRDVVPPASFWIGRAMVPPSRRHRLWVWGQPGTVLGYLDAGPAGPVEHTDSDPDGEAEGVGGDGGVGEVCELYVDPTAQHRGAGGALLEAAVEWFRSHQMVAVELNVLDSNPAAQKFYLAHGWTDTGRRTLVDLGIVSFVERRFRLDL